MQNQFENVIFAPPVKAYPLEISFWNFARVIVSGRWPRMLFLVSIGSVVLLFK